MTRPSVRRVSAGWSARCSCRCTATGPTWSAVHEWAVWHHLHHSWVDVAQTRQAYERADYRDYVWLHGRGVR